MKFNHASPETKQSNGMHDMCAGGGAEFTSEGVGEEAEHLVQGDAALHLKRQIKLDVGCV
jgi:hypothetical protein